MKSKGLRILVAEISMLFLLPILIELLIFNYHGLFESRNTVSLEQIEKNVFAWEEKNQYFSVIEIVFESDDDAEYTVEVNGGTIKLNDITNCKLGYSATKIKEKCNNIKVIFPKTWNGRIKKIYVDNKIYFSWTRVLALWLLGFVLSVIIDRKLVNILGLQGVFIIVAITTGLILIGNIGVRTLSWDSQIHFRHAWNLSFINEVENSTTVEAVENLTCPYGEGNNTLEERKNYEEWMNINYIDKTDIANQDTFSYKRTAYLPLICGLVFARKMNLSFVNSYYFGELFNLLFYSIIFAFGIAWCKRLKYILFVIGLLPISIFIASSYSYDSFITAMITVGVAIILDGVISRSIIDFKLLIVSIGMIAVGSLTKAIYIPLLLIILFIPKEKINRYGVMIKILAFIMVLVIMSTFVMPTAGTTLSGGTIVGDARGGDTSVSEQLIYVLTNPVSYMLLFIKSVATTLCDYFINKNVFFAYYSFKNGTSALLLPSVIYFIVLCFVGLTQGAVVDKKTNLIKYKIVDLFIILIVILLIWTSLYLSFTPVGANVINGVQSRYYIPLFLPVFFMMWNNKFKINEKKYFFIVLIAMSIVWFMTIISMKF